MDLDNLENIQRMEAPPFLFTRIQQKIEQSKKERMPKTVAITLSLSFLMMIVLNAMVFFKYNSKTPSTESFAQSMHITSNNSLY